MPRFGSSLAYNTEDSAGYDIAFSGIPGRGTDKRIDPTRPRRICFAVC